MTAVATTILLAALAQVELATFPAHGPDAAYFMAPVGPEPKPALFCLHDRTLSVYPLPSRAQPITIDLPEETSAVDAFDLNGDGAVEVIAIAGERLLRFVVAPAGATPAPPQELFRAPSLFRDATAQPFLHGLGVIWQEQRLLGLPNESHFTLYDARGEVVERWAIGLDAAPQAALGRPFHARVLPVPVLGPPGALEMRVRREVAIEPALPEALPIAPPEWGNRSGLADTYASAGANYVYWPAFPLNVVDSVAADVSAELRGSEVLYAFDFASAPATVTRLRAPGRTGQEDSYRVEPPARYAGLRLGADFPPPDFNRDGLADLLLWRDAAAMPSAALAAKSLTTGTRSVRITVHPFEPARRRFASLPATAFSVDVPNALTGAAITAPMRHLLVADINGDGATDLAFATRDNTYTVWLHNEQGFAEKPDWQHAFPSPIEALLFHGPFGGKGEGLALRTREHVYALLPTAGPAHPSAE